MRTLDQVRDFTGYLRTCIFALIASVVLLILLIALILREMKGTFRCAELLLRMWVVLTTIISLVIKKPGSNFIPENDLPAAVQTWIPRLSAIYCLLGHFTHNFAGSGYYFIGAFLTGQKTQAGSRISGPVSRQRAYYQF